MRYEYIEPFVLSTMRVLDSVLQSDIARGDVSLVNSREISGDISIVIYMKGNSEGNIILNMDTETALKICNYMTGEEFELVTHQGLDPVAELANMIAGNSTSSLNDLGADFNVSPPLVVMRDDDLLKKGPAVEAFQVPLFTEYGEITLNIAMRTS